jgi:hypothetical protein
MSDYIKKLAEQAGMEWETQSWCWLANPPHLERFAKLVRQDERTSNSKTIDVTDIVLRAKAEEREACAKLCENVVSNEGYVQSKWCAAAIRARGEPDPAFKNYMGDNWAGIV